VCEPPLNSYHQPFNKSDKIALLKALNTFGYSDLRNVQKLLPHKTIPEIEIFLKHWKARGMLLPYSSHYFKRIKGLANVDSWISAVQKTRSSLCNDELVKVTIAGNITKI